MLKRFRKRIIEGLESLSRRLERVRKPADVSETERQIGRLLGKNSRAAGKYQVRLLEDDSVSSKLRLQWLTRKDWDEWARHSEGCYLLRTNVTDWTADDLWRTYIQLTDAEAAFRIQKSELSLRPIWHQKTDRVLAHIFVCFLAYVLWKTLSQMCDRAGLGSEPRRVLDELGELSMLDVVLPTRAGIEIRKRCLSKPTDHQQILLDHLQLRLPKIKQTEM